jgi:peptide/nickel transport system permease protein
MIRWLARRLVLSLITLWLLATIVFVIANVLPNDVGRTIAGPFAPQETVDAINERLGTNDPLPEQYLRASRSCRPSSGPSAGPGSWRPTRCY